MPSAISLKRRPRWPEIRIQTILEAAGSDLAHVVMVTVLLHDWKYFEGMNEVFAEYFGQKPPARSTICGERRPEGALVAMSAIAVMKD